MSSWTTALGSQCVPDSLNEAADQVVEPQGHGAIYELVISNLDDISFVDMRSKNLRTAVDKWSSIINMDLTMSSTGIQISKLDIFNFDAERAVIQAVIGTRSPTTAVSRANAILRFVRWVSANTAEDTFAFDEQIVWKYLQHLEQDNKAATVGPSLMSAFNYARFVFGFSILTEITDSKRLHGLCDILFAKKKLLRQAKVLSVKDVLRLKCMVEDESLSPVDRALSGYVIAALYGRCRHSDLSMIHCIVHDFDNDGGYLEIHTAVHKNARNAVLKATLLPIIAPAVGVNGKCWPLAVEKAFNAVGLSFRGLINGLLFRPPKAGCDGQLCQRGITSTECARFLREVCGDKSAEPDVLGSAYSSHSLKSTCLSWCAENGMGHGDRAVLGRHSSAHVESSAIYSRDLSARSVRLLQAVISEIHQGAFDPDAARKDYFKSVTQLQDQSVTKIEDSPKAVEEGSHFVEGEALQDEYSEGGSSTTHFECVSSGESEDAHGGSSSKDCKAFS